MGFTNLGREAAFEFMQREAVNHVRHGVQNVDPVVDGRQVVWHHKHTASEANDHPAEAVGTINGQVSMRDEERRGERKPVGV